MKAYINGKTTTNIDELKQYLVENKLNVYQGYDLNSSAFVFSFTDYQKSVKITYDNLYDCKKTELELKKVCSKFYPKKFKVKKRKSINISQETKSELDNLREGTQSYEMIIWKLILEHYGEI